MGIEMMLNPRFNRRNEKAILVLITKIEQFAYILKRQRS